MTSSLSTYARQVLVSVSEFIHRSAEPVDNDGAKERPAFFAKAVEDLHEEVVRGKPFSVADIVRGALSQIGLV